VPRLWTETIETHRREVRDAVLDATARLVAEGGMLGVTMSQIAEEAGIGRATLYKYFPDAEAVLAAWHERHISRRLEYLSSLRDQHGSPGERLAGVLEAYALISHGDRGHEHGVLLHHREHVPQAERQLAGFAEDLIAEAAAAGEVRDDITPAEMASYCLHALQAAASLTDDDAVRRLVTLTLAGLRAPTPSQGGHRR
jgi:AcrR family transcriptional regulator